MTNTEKLATTILIITLLSSLIWSTTRFYLTQTVIIPATGGEYREALVGQPHFINPALASSSTDLAITRLVYDALYTYNNEGKLIPQLAAELPHIAENQKFYTIILKQNASWHNGKPITADDVVFTFNLIQNPAFHSPYYELWQNTSIEKLDAYTVIFKNKDISAPFVHNLTFPIMPLSVWEHINPSDFDLPDLNLEAIGSGPYSVKEINKLPNGKIQHILLERFENYHITKPNIESIYLKFYDSIEDALFALDVKDVDGAGWLPSDTDPNLSPKRNGIRVQTFSLPQYQAVFFNTQNTILKDRKVRYALSLITNRETILNSAHHGNGHIISGPLVPEQLGFLKISGPELNTLEAAENLLTEAGWRKNREGLRQKGNKILELTLTTDDSLVNIRTVKILQEQWSKVGVKVNIQNIPSAEIFNSVIKPRSFECFVFFQKLGADPDPFAFWHSSQITDPGLNITGFASTAADAVITKARTTTNETDRISNYQEFQRIISQEVPALFLVQSTYNLATDEHVQNIQSGTLIDSTYRYKQIAYWSTAYQRSWR